jgi:glycosyltransferase involved in cell wall biosynthesis
LPITFSDFFPNSKQLKALHSEWLRLIGEMDGYIAISAAVRDEVSSWIDLNCPAVPRHFHRGFFHLGADLESSIPSTGLPSNYVETLRKLHGRTTFLQVSTLEPRKAPEQLLDCFELLWAKGIDINLVLVGKKGWLVDRLASRINDHNAFGDRLFWLQGISDEMLDLVYAASTCCIMASYGEGFGLPIVEAAQKKLPVIARDIPVFREVAGTNAYYFKASTPSDLASSIEEWLDLYASRQHPASEGMPCITWSTSAAQLVASLLEAVNRQVPACIE